jgi:ADP-ribosylglycohydrolase
MTKPIASALLSLEGLSVGDAFGETFFTVSPSPFVTRQLPAGPWRWTDDTHMALSIVDVLRDHGHIDQDALARRLAERFTADPQRSYAVGVTNVLTAISRGEDWRTVSLSLFGGKGSYSNGAAKRAAPIGGFFAGQPARAATEAQRSAVVTHAHPEGQAGAIAVAVAAAIAAKPNHPKGRDFLQAVAEFVPPGETRERIEAAFELPGDDLMGAVRRLGNGQALSAQDTVPFSLWSAAYHFDDFEKALWGTADGLGDCDTMCAIVGGIVALSVGQVPPTWVEHREPLPTDFRRG